jgi:hypothetical protein
MPAASSGAYPVVLTQSIRPMGLLEASLGLASVAAARKAVKTWAARRQFGGGKNHNKMPSLTEQATHPV